MPIIKNIGKRDRMVADRILKPGEAKYISPKQALQFVGIPDYEIVDETPEVKAEVRIQKDEEPLQAQPEVDPIDRRLVEAELKLEPIRYPKKRRSIEPGRENPAPTPTTKRKKSRGSK